VRVLGPRIQHVAVLELLGRFGSPEQLREAGISQIAKVQSEGAANGRAIIGCGMTAR
jgi:ERCC4-type nuclease